MFDDMMADMGANEKLSPVVIELFMGGRKLNIPNHNFMSKHLKK